MQKFRLTCFLFLIRNKHSILISLHLDVVIDSLRSGILGKYGLSQETLMKENSRLIHCRLSGFGSNNSYQSKPGHDISFNSLNGILSLFGRKNEGPFIQPPTNMCSGPVCAFAICAALIERSRSGKGQAVDLGMVESSAYIWSVFLRSYGSPSISDRSRGYNIFDGGAHFYETYETKDGKFISVGTIEPKFYSVFLRAIGLNEEEYPYDLDEENAEKCKRKFKELVKNRTRDEWWKIFEPLNCCVFPVLDPLEALEHPYNKEREVFVSSEIAGDSIIPNPAPKLSRTPAASNLQTRDPLTTAIEILTEINYDKHQIQSFIDDGILLLTEISKL